MGMIPAHMQFREESRLDYRRKTSSPIGQIVLGLLVGLGAFGLAMFFGLIR